MVGKERGRRVEETPPQVLPDLIVHYFQSRLGPLTQGFSINQVVHLHRVCCDAAQHTQDSTHSTHCTPLSGVPIIKFHLMNAFMS